VVLAAGLLGALVGGAIGYVTYEPCVSEEFLGCLFEDREVDVFLGVFWGLLIGTCAGLLLLPFWPRAVPPDQRSDRLDGP
jgi:hypothetical protein